MEFDTGDNESHHNTTKRGAMRAQRTFDNQVAKRMFEYSVIKRAMREIEERITHKALTVTDQIASESSSSESEPPSVEDAQTDL